MKRELNETLSRNIVRMRIQNRYSQREIADQLGIAQSSYNRIESGISKLSAVQVFILARFYQVLVDELFDPNANFEESGLKMAEKLETMAEQQAREKILYNVVMSRNLELEEKIKRRDKKIDSLTTLLKGEGYKNKIEASASLTSITICIIVLSMLVSMMVVYGHLSSTFSSTDRWHQLSSNLRSGFQLLLHSAEFNDRDSFDLFGAGNDSVMLKKQNWGVYESCFAMAFRQGDTLIRSAFLGTSSIDSGVALYLKDTGRPLSLAGDSRIKGNSFLPFASFRRVLVEGTEFTGEVPKHAQLHSSSDTLPRLRESFITPIRKMLWEDPATVQGYGLPQYDLYVPFYKPTRFIYLDDSTRLTHLALKGNILIHSNSKIEIDSNANLEDILIFAPSIRVKEGFQGSIQLFARDSIHLERNVRLHYPSAIGVSPDSAHFTDSKNVRNVLNRVTLENGVSLFGVLFLDDLSKRVNSTIRIHPNVQIYGQVYSSGYLDHRGEIIGSSVVSGLLAQTTSTKYENYLIDGVFDSESISPFFSGSPIFSDRRAASVLKWL